mgnify:CR=1 FL=1
MSISSDNTTSKPILVGGIGNILMGDDGIGVHVVRELAAEHGPFPDTEISDLGTPGMALLHSIAERHKVILVDCADFDQPAGTCRCFSPEQAHSVKKMSGFSLHEGDLFQILKISRDLGEAPSETILVGIQPGNVSPKERLSPAVTKQMNDYVNLLKKLICNTDCRPCGNPPK